MNSEIDNTPPTTSYTEEVTPHATSETMGGERQYTGYASGFGDTFRARSSDVLDFVTARPLLTGSIAVGATGAFLGSRLGHMLAMRRRKTYYDRAMDMLGLFVAMLGTAFSKENREKAVERIVDTGRGVIGSTDEVRSSLMDRLPSGAGSMMEMVTPEEKPSAIKQVGYGLSLIPITMALIRNPLIRAIGFRFLARRIRPKRRK